MKKLLLAVLATAVLAIVPAAKATTIPYGTFGWVTGGAPTYTGETLGTASSVTFNSTQYINSAPATYLGKTDMFYGSAFTISPFVYVPVTMSPLTLNVENINSGSTSYNLTDYLQWTWNGDTFDFTLTSGTWTSSASTNLSFVGLGTFSDTLNDYVSGPAEVSFSFTQTGTTNVSSTFEVPPPVVPEPSSLVLFGTGLLGAAFLLFRRNRTAQNGSIA